MNFNILLMKDIYDDIYQKKNMMTIQNQVIKQLTD